VAQCNIFVWALPLTGCLKQLKIKSGVRQQKERGGQQMPDTRKWLIALRNNKKGIDGSPYTQQNVADEAGIDRSFYTQIENGQRSPSVKTAKKIAKVLEFNWTLFFAEDHGVKQQQKTG
jgi:putative transcriptional regulator